ncbi:MAG: hypothetical protein K6E22_00355 [Treponema sp.]|nr:hypothetical protein [Treponema sp.]
MKKNVIVVTIIDVIALCTVLLSYYIKKQIGYVFYNWLVIFFVIAFIIYSLMVVLANRKISIFMGQLFCCVFICLMVKLDLPDRFALLIEVPKMEKKIEKIKHNEIDNEAITIFDEYIISDWEPGFLDYQWVLVYDANDSLQNISDSKKIISEGKLYILYRAKKCFYLCILYR